MEDILRNTFDNDKYTIDNITNKYRNIKGRFKPVEMFRQNIIYPGLVLLKTSTTIGSKTLYTLEYLILTKHSFLVTRRIISLITGASTPTTGMQDICRVLVLALALHMWKTLARMTHAALHMAIVVIGDPHDQKTEVNQTRH